MQRRLVHRFAAFAAVFACLIAAAPGRAGEVTSRMRTVPGVFESNGYRIEPVDDAGVRSEHTDLATPQAYEIIRPDINQPITIGRLFTSCSCIRLEAEQRSFGPGERAILVLRNIRATPANGQMYAFFVQLNEPMKTTLRFDTFVQSGVGIGAQTSAPAPASAPAAAPAPAAVPGLNNQLAAALTAVGAPAPAAAPAASTPAEPGVSAVDATGDIAVAPGEAGDPSLSLPAGDDVRESLGDARDTLEAALQANAQDAAKDVHSSVDAARQTVGGHLEQDPLAAPGDDLPDFYAQPAAKPEEAAAPAEESLKPPAPEASGKPGEAEGAGQPGPLAAADTSDLTEDQILQLQRLALIQAEEQAKQLADRVQQLRPAPDAAAPAPADGAEKPAAAATPSPARSAAAAALAGRPVQAVSLITIGVRDMPSSIRFYEALGWQRAARGKYDQTAFFQLNGQVLALYPVADLLLEQNMVGAAPAPGGITLALHVQEKDDVADVYQRFIDAGGRSLRAPAEMASGAVSSYVADPDGNPWEISWVPQFTIDPNGDLWLP